MILGVPTLCCYDRLTRLIASAEAGSMKPSGYLIVDNGGGLSDFWRHRSPAEGVALELYVPLRNLGVARSWNWLMQRAGDAIVLSNDDIVLGRDTFRSLASRIQQVPWSCADGFALFGITKACRERVGWFDEHFFPAYFEDVDYAHRMRLAGVALDAIERTSEHAASSTLRALPPLERDKIHAGWKKNREYYMAKWGGDRGAEAFTVAFDGAPPPGWKERD